MKVTVENEKIKVNSQYNKSFVAGAKQIQGKWNAPCWVFPERTRKPSRRCSSNATESVESLVRSALSQ